jgi:hypothetical protein
MLKYFDQEIVSLMGSALDEAKRVTTDEIDLVLSEGITALAL